VASSVNTLFVSPHFDDVALSCGGTAALLARTGRVTVVTVFGGLPPAALNAFAQFQHQRWQTGDTTVDYRRREDLAAMRALGVDYQWLDYPDAIYREDLYLSDEELFGPLKSEDRELRISVREALFNLASHTAAHQVYLPLAVGHHVDHQLCRDVAKPLAEHGLGVSYYEDFPYAASPGSIETALQKIARPLTPHVIDVTSTIEQRLAAIHCYTSQLPTIFRHYGKPDQVVRDYASRLSGHPHHFAERFWIYV